MPRKNGQVNAQLEEVANLSEEHTTSQQTATIERAVCDRILRRRYIVKAKNGMRLEKLESRLDEYVTKHNTVDNMLVEGRVEGTPYFLTDTGAYKVVESAYDDLKKGGILGSHEREFYLLLEGKPKDFALVESYFNSENMKLRRVENCDENANLNSLIRGDFHHKKSLKDKLSKHDVDIYISAITLALAFGAYTAITIIRGANNSKGYFQTVKEDFFGKQPEVYRAP